MATRTLWEAIEARIPETVDFYSQFFKEQANRHVTSLTLGSIAEGMKRKPVLLAPFPPTMINGVAHSPHFVDPYQGLHICGTRVDKLVLDEKPSIESIVWMYFTGLRPTAEEEAGLVDDLNSRRERLKDVRTWSNTAARHIYCCIWELGKESPVDLLGVLQSTLTVLDSRSRTHLAAINGDYTKITPKDRFDDMMDILAILPIIIPKIFSMVKVEFGKIEQTIEGSTAEVFAKNVALKRDRAHLSLLTDAINLLFTIMSYHGVGNVSTFSGLITQSGGATVCQSYIALLAGLSGFNHGGAAPQALNFLFRLHQAVGDRWTPDTVAAFARDHIIEKKRPVLAVGHALLERDPSALPEDQGDPRTRALLDFMDRNFPDHWLYRLGRCWYDTALPMVQEHHKIAFPAVNVDGYTGILEYALGIIPYGTENTSMALAIFALARWGAMPMLLWNCASNKKGTPGILRPGELYLPLAAS